MLFDFFMFIDLYYRYFLIFEFFYKLNNYLFLFLFSFVFIQFIDFLKFSTYLFSRFFRNVRLNFVFFKIIILKNLRKYLNNRKKLYFLNSYFLNFFGHTFFFNFEFLLFEIFRVLFKYRLSLYMNVGEKRNFVCFFWNDIYSNLVDLNDMIIFRDFFIFKYDLPHLLYFFYFYFVSVEISCMFLAFFGFFFFFKKRFFKFKFFSQIL